MGEKLDNAEVARQSVLQIVDDLQPVLLDLSERIYQNPEVAYEEVKASNWIAELLADEGFRVERKTAGLETALKGVWEGAQDPKIAFLAEYDALPGIGHGCGHNLIAAMSVGAAIACRRAGIPAHIELVGTPAEESGGGKVAMTEAGVFDGLDTVMMIHPSRYTTVGRSSLALRAVRFKFFGKAAHAAGQPEQGINALSAAVGCYSAINAAREHMLPDVRVHGIISQGGKAPNIVPDFAELYYYVRSRTLAGLEEAYERVLRCAEGAATTTGARLEVEELATYRERVESQPLVEAFAANLDALEEPYIDPSTIKAMGSSDIGNISHVAPTIHAYIKIVDEPVPGHTPELVAASWTDQAKDALIRGAKLMALTATDIAYDREVVRRLRQDIAERLSRRQAG